MDMSKIVEMYRKWRKENNNRKPNRVIVKVHWEDDPEKEQSYEVIGIAPDYYWLDHDDDRVLYWVSTIPGLTDLTQPGNGSDFIVDEVLKFCKL